MPRDCWMKGHDCDGTGVIAEDGPAFDEQGDPVDPNEPPENEPDLIFCTTECARVFRAMNGEAARFEEAAYGSDSPFTSTRYADELPEADFYGE